MLCEDRFAAVLGAGARSARGSPPARGGLALVLALALGSCGGGGGEGAGAGTQDATLAPSPTLALTRVLPASADVAGALTVQVEGAGFPVGSGPVYVLFGLEAAPATVLSPTLLSAALPPGAAPGAVDVAVCTPTGLVVQAAAFEYLPSPPPLPGLTCLPTTGSFVAGLGGTRVDLTLTHFPPLNAPTVLVGGLPAGNVQVLAPDLLRMEVPDGLPAGQLVAVTVSDGGAVALASLFHQGTVTPGTLVINELLPDPGAQDANRDGTLSSTGDEFVEIVNGSGAVVDLTGWTLSDSTSVRHTFPNPTTVPNGGSIVVFGGGNPTYFAPRHASGHAQLAATGTLGLNNSADSVILRSPAGTTVAQVNYLSGDVSAGRSRTLSPDARAVPVPAASTDYVFHDLAAGATAPLSPGVKVNGAAFP